MKREMDLVRAILLACESHETGYAPEDLKIDGFTDNQVGYHLLLMVEAGLLVGEETTTFGSDSPEAMATRLTWAGHEFLDSARNETLWKKTVGKVKTATGGVTFELLKWALLTGAQTAISHVTGIPAK